MFCVSVEFFLKENGMNAAFVALTDDTFAMLVLENNISKWMDELVRHVQSVGNEERRRTLYTQGQQG